MGRLQGKIWRSNMGRASFDQVEMDPVTMNEAVEYISTIMCEPRTRTCHVVTVNAQFVQLARSEARFAEVIRRADLSVADGVSLVWASRFMGQPLPERVNGTDLMVRLCEAAASNRNSVYFFGGLPDAAKMAADALQQRFPGFIVAGIECPSFGFEKDATLDKEASDRIRQAEPDLVLVALGSPKAEYWIQQHLHLPAKVMVGIGGSFELVAGITRRAPRIFQKSGCEWLWRLAIEPRRLWKRYCIGNTLFVYLFLRQWAGREVPKISTST
jgi:N-acetylglucosaminyldiphosphoundecaprenol N-acetyl-beta-D-mannosaminyltransferase